MTSLLQARVILISVTILSLMGCSMLRPYKMDIHQGNIIESEKVEKIKVGMNRSQVRQLLGTPMLDDAFQKKQDDYIYYTKPGYGEASEQRITIRFENEKVSSIEKLVPIESKVHP
ncbi:MAG: outer membrane protein assembly factor BamE [Gammaproteobacteria bacterium]